MTAGQGSGDLWALSRHKQVRVRATAASHPLASPDLLTAAAQDSSRTIRRIVAGRLDTPAEALRALAADTDQTARKAVATNPATPTDVLVTLLADPHWSIRLSIVDNPATDLTVQRAMCQAADQNVRLVLAQRTGLPPEITTLLAGDPHREVREALAERTHSPATLQALLRDEAPRVRAKAGMNPATTAAQRRELVHDPAWEARCSVVWSKVIHGWDIPEDDLLILARDRSATVRYWLANLPSATRRVYEVLAQDPDADIALNASLWLLPSDDPRHPDDLVAHREQEFRDFFGHVPMRQEHYGSPEYLGQPIPQMTAEGVEELIRQVTQKHDRRAQ